MSRLVYLDTETMSLRPGCRAWEAGLIAACGLARATDALPAGDQPVGWSS